MHFKVKRLDIQKWVMNSESIKNQLVSRSVRRINDPEKCNKRAKYYECEIELYKHILERRASNFCVTIHSIQYKMIQLVHKLRPIETLNAPIATVNDPIETLYNLKMIKESELKHFQASYGWAKRFMRRYNLTLRIISGSGRAFTPNNVNVIHEYLKQARAMEYSENEIFNFDETSHYMDAVGSVTISVKGQEKLML